VAEREREAARVYTMEELRSRTPDSGTAGKKEHAPRTPAEPRTPTEPKAPKAPAKAPDPLMPAMTNVAADKAIMGRSIADRPIEMKELTADAGLVTVQGDIFRFETKELKGGETLLVTFAVTDYTSSIMCKVFMRYRKGQFGRPRDGQELPPITDEERKAVQDKVAQIKVGMNVKLRGECSYDNFSHELSIMVRDMVPMKKIEREDKAEEKRVELHMHSNMSTMDAMTPVEQLVKRAAKWGHPAVAITDHGVLQAFPAAFKAAKGAGIKLIPGCEGYLINDVTIMKDADHRLCEEPIVVLDFETTGLNTASDRVIEIGAVKMQSGTITDSLSVLVNPKVPLPPRITEITGINDNMLADKQTAEVEIPKLMDFIGGCAIAAHNAAFDVPMLRAELKRLGMEWNGPVLDTLGFSRKLFTELKNHKLATVCKQCGVNNKNAHRAVHDATATAQCLRLMFREAKERFGAEHLDELDDKIDTRAIGKSYHIILLAKTQAGLVNLNRLVSISHLEHFKRQPHMPHSVIEQYRDGLILGSACEAGELYQALYANEPWERLKSIASWYDFIEIQPVGNNEFMIRNGMVKDENELRELNRKLVKLADELGKPCVATGDVHFLDPHNAVNRAIIQAAHGYDDCDKQPPLYFKTTDEMLAEFAYLGPEKAREVVIGNPRRIADMVEDLRLFPKHPTGADTFQPVWEDAADNVQKMTWDTAHDLYGDPLPDVVKARIDKELRSIVGYGYCTLYNIAQKMVLKSVEDGYLVGSRGSVGSSLVARLIGITEVNALPPHYRCPTCHKGFFDVDKARYKTGMDLPDRECPHCGRRLKKDGYDIPFEVFLGFNGDKVPDIDLNFANAYQNRAHHYVEELFGRDHVFRAGTISGVADKTAYGYVKHYMEERSIQASNTEIERLAAGCEGVKRTTGQHPGGMVVVPKEYEIYQFTAVQHPADDLNSDFTTTHFDFNSMHDILVKLDCLGHLDPTMMHMLKELTHIDYQDVPLDDWDVRSLFASPKALGVTEEMILCSTGTYGVPEFGTGFVRGMLDETKPSTMEELVRISGLSHGTNVWLDNAQTLVASGTAKLSECLCCRDDIMNYLLDKGCEPKIAFKTMENVRKGKGITDEMVQAMVDHEVPEWFMDSCRKIQYMFPKGHAVAYVTMSLRVAWFKLHHPLAYYASYFTIRGNGFDASTMLIDPDVMRSRIKELREGENITAHEKDSIPAMELVLEMNCRGIKMLPVDLYKSAVTEFLIEGCALRCPFTSLSGLGESAAAPIVEARAAGPFLSIEDLQRRAKIGSGVIDLLRAHGSLEGLSETSQISMFSM